MTAVKNTQKNTKKTDFSSKKISLREFGRRPRDFLEDLPLVLTIYNKPEYMLVKYPSDKAKIEPEASQEAPPAPKPVPDIKRASQDSKSSSKPVCDMPGCSEKSTERYEHYNFCSVHYEHVLQSL